MSSMWGFQYPLIQNAHFSLHAKQPGFSFVSFRGSKNHGFGSRPIWVWPTCATGFGDPKIQRGEMLLYCVPPKTHEVGSSCCSLFTPSFLETGDFCMILPSFQVLGFFLFVFGFFTCGNDRNICVAHHGVARSHQVLRPCRYGILWLLEERPRTLALVCHLM